mmetsp:Transcript_20226/g.41320  ORF Transcript_20226/g.41320 Transcript_20226/m.41320 type:complete len:682 (-) Transcript_20226:1713-3758(-)
MLCVHEHDQLRTQRESPAHRVRRHDHLHGATRVQIAHGALLVGREPLVQEGDAVGDRVRERALLDLAQKGRHVIGSRVQEAARRVVGGGEREQVDGRELCLLGRRHKDDGRLVDGVVDHGVVGGLAHGEQPTGHVRDVVALDVNLERYRPHVGVEVEEAVVRAADPLGEVLGIGERGGEREDAHLVVGLAGDVTHARDHDLEHRPHLPSDEVHLVDDEQRDVLHVLALLPPAREHVPPLRRRDDHRAALEQLEVGCRLAAQHLDGDAHLAQAELPRSEALLGQLQQGCDVHTAAARRVLQHAQDGELSADGLARARRRTDEHALVRVEEGREDLRLNRVEVRKVRLVEAGVLAQRRDGQRAQVEQLGVRRVLLGQDEVAEGDGQRGLRAQPGVGDDAYEVLRRQRVGDGDGEGDGVVVLGEFGLEDEDLVVEHLLLVHILDEYVEGLRVAVHLGLKLEVGRDGQLHAQYGTCDGLHVRGELEPRELVDEAVDGLAHLGEADELADLLRLQVVEALPLEVFLLDLLDDILGDARELAQRRLREPHALVDHLAHVEHPIGQPRPAALEHDLVDAAHQPRGGLRDVDHVGEQREAVQLDLRDVRLQQHVGLGGGLVDALLDGDGHALDQPRQLLLLLLAHRDVGEVLGEREEAEQLDVAQCRLEELVVHGDGGVAHVVVGGHTA